MSVHFRVSFILTLILIKNVIIGCIRTFDFFRGHHKSMTP